MVLGSTMLIGIPSRYSRPIDTHGHGKNRSAMTWKDRQRIRLPCVDLDDNPFCVDRRMNEERHMMQLNRNPSLVHLTSADVPRTASFKVDGEKPFRDFSKKKRHLLAWSLRAASTPDEDHNGSGGSKAAPKQSAMHRSRSVPSNLPGDAHIEVADDLAQRSSRRRRQRDRSDVDVDTLPNLEPYRHEVVAQKSITFGHRPASGSRMFNPSTMATSFGAGDGGGGGSGGGGGGGRGGGGLRREVRRGNAGGARRNHKPTRTPPSLRKGRARRIRRSPGLSASMLREILLGGEDQRGESTRFSGIGESVLATVGANGEVSMGYRGSVEGHGARGKPHGVPGSRNAVEDPENELRGALNSSVSRSVGPDGGGIPGGFDVTRLTRSGRVGTRRHQGGREEGTRQGTSFDEIELRRIFAADRPPWDGTPAPLPAPQDTRRAVSSLLMPDPDERLRDKIVRSRKLAAGIPVTAASTKDERECDAQPETPSGRWEVPPDTPRTVIACEETKRLVEARRERDGVLARRVRQAELSVFYKKIARSERDYRDTLVRGLNRQGVAAGEVAVIAAAAARGEAHQPRFK